MQGSSQRSQATRALVTRLEQRETGILSVGRGPALLQLMVWDGDLVAAVSPDDAEQLAAHCKKSGLNLPDGAAESLASLSEALEPDALAPMLHARFVENICRFVGSPAKPRFDHRPVVFADTLQVGHDSSALVRHCAQQWDDALSIDLDLDVTPGPAAPKSDDQQRILAGIQSGKDVGETLQSIPIQPVAGRAMVARMLRDGILMRARRGSPDTQNPAPARAFGPGSTLRMPTGPGLGDPYFGLEDTASSDPRTPIPVPYFQATNFSQQHEPSGDPRTMDTGPTDTFRSSPPPPIAEPEPELPSENTPSGTGDLSSFDAWMGHGVEVEADLDAFGDYDESRSGTDGEFSTEAHNLDRVEVLADFDEPLQMDAAPISHFNAPDMPRQVAEERLHDCSSMLEHFASVVDRQSGSGRGQTIIQVAMDALSPEWSNIFDDIEVKANGALPTGAIWDNLTSRPASEHRRVLSGCLVALIEQCLNVAVEELSDDLFDDVLVAVQGYRQRLGL